MTNLEKRPNYRSLAEQIRAENSKIKGWFSNKPDTQDDIESILGLVETMLELTETISRKVPKDELKIAKATANFTRQAREELRGDHGIQDMPTLNQVEEVLNRWIVALQSRKYNTTYHR